jgi:hypothetical protein
MAEKDLKISSVASVHSVVFILSSFVFVFFPLFASLARLFSPPANRN